MTSNSAILESAPPFAGSKRIDSIDALRGFDMFWIIGGDRLLRSLPNIHDDVITRTVADQMEHVPFAGLHAYDLIFPVFVFIVGVAIPFSLRKIVDREGRRVALRRVVIRGVILFLLGVFYMGGVANGFSNVYFAGVLQRIGVAYLFAGLLFIFFRSRTLAIFAGVILLTYWALLTFVPVPGIGHASYEHGKNLAYWIDQRYLPGQKFEGTILSTPAAVANCLLGIFAGLILKDSTRSELSKVGALAVFGFALLLAGFLWSFQFPIIKLLWTSSYVLIACGIGAILLSLFHLIIEVLNFRTWCRPFIWIGSNAITIYLLSSVANFSKLADRIVGGNVATFLGPWAATVNALVALMMAIWVVWLLYQRKIFFRL
jgi:predicted acyltransferase